MIEKIEPLQELEKHSLFNKINELVDAVNKQDKAIRLLINGLECFANGQQLMNREIEIKG